MPGAIGFIVLPGQSDINSVASVQKYAPAAGGNNVFFFLIPMAAALHCL